MIDKVRYSQILRFSDSSIIDSDFSNIQMLNIGSARVEGCKDSATIESRNAPCLETTWTRVREYWDQEGPILKMTSSVLSTCYKDDRRVGCHLRGTGERDFPGIVTGKAGQQCMQLAGGIVCRIEGDFAPPC